MRAKLPAGVPGEAKSIKTMMLPQTCHFVAKVPSFANRRLSARCLTTLDAFIYPGFINRFIGKDEIARDT